MSRAPRMEPRMQRAVTEHPGQAKDRPCMRCGKVFRSPSFGVRHCDACRKAVADESW